MSENSGSSRRKRDRFHTTEPGRRSFALRAFWPVLGLLIYVLLTPACPAFSEITWTETQPAGNADEKWASVAISPDGSKMAAAVYGGRVYANGSWTETQPAGNADEKWASVAMSSDGSTMLAAGGDRIYLYRNGSWAETQPAGNADKNWVSVAISPDGSTMLAASVPSYGGRIYLYRNGSWTETQPAGNGDEWWVSVAMSSGGSTMLAAVNGPHGGRIYLYSNNLWAETRPAGDKDNYWRSVAISPDRSTMLAGVYGGRIYLYRNGSWTETQPTGVAEDKGWSSVAMSSDGLTMLAAGGDRIYLYRNGSWTETQPAGNADKSWESVAISPDGLIMLAAGGDKIYLYRNGSWAETQPAGAVNKQWSSLALSSGGSKMLAGTWSGRLYLGKDSTLVTLTSFAAHMSRDNTVALSWETGSEIDNAGFHAWRSHKETGEYARITTTLIPAQGSPSQCAAYTYTDRQGSSSDYYKLEDIDDAGVSTFHGPIPVIVNASSITLRSPENNASFPPLPPTFAWEATGLGRFRIQFSKTLDFTGRIAAFPASWLRSMTYTPNKMQWNAVSRFGKGVSPIYWRVIGIGRNGKPVTSEAFTLSNGGAGHFPPFQGAGEP